MKRCWLGAPIAWACGIMALVMVAAFVLPSCSPAAPISAATGLTVSGSVQSTFPTLMTFKVKAQSDANVVKLRLHYIVRKQNVATVVSEGWAQFDPATSVDTQWLLDMRKAGLPPGTQMEYWWTAEDAGGKTAETAHATTSFDDTRYKWQSIATPPVTLLWYNGNSAFANALMGAAQDGLQRIQNNTGATPQRQVRIFIYASAQDLQGAQLFAQAWEGGAAFVEFDVVAIGVATSDLDWGKGAVAHELTHWIVGQLTFNNYGAGLPVWLDEGLAMYGEGPNSVDYPVMQQYLNAAIKANALLSVRTLSSPFSAVTQLALLSYAESLSIVTFLVNTFGKDKMVQMLSVFHQGATYDQALTQVYGFDQDGLDSRWRQSLGARTASAPLKGLAMALPNLR